jgi:hypothetical protein
MREPRRPGVARAGMSYYRAAFNSRLIDPRHDDLRAATDAPIHVHVPTLLALGARDGCIDPKMARSAVAAFRGPYEERTIACGHFRSSNERTTWPTSRRPGSPEADGPGKANFQVSVAISRRRTIRTHLDRAGDRE